MLNEILAEIEARADAANLRWSKRHLAEDVKYVQSCWSHEYGDLARTDVPRLVAAVRELVKQRDAWFEYAEGCLELPPPISTMNEQTAAILRGESHE